MAVATDSHRTSLLTEHTSFTTSSRHHKLPYTPSPQCVWYVSFAGILRDYTPNILYCHNYPNLINAHVLCQPEAIKSNSTKFYLFCKKAPKITPIPRKGGTVISAIGIARTTKLRCFLPRCKQQRPYRCWNRI